MKPNSRIIVRLGTLIVTVLAQLSISQNARASCAPNHIIYVSASGSGADGCSWATAYPFLQDAIALSTNGDQIWVATGTYFPDQGAAPIIDNDRNSTFNLKDGVAIYGGFTVGNTLLSQRNSNPATNGTVLSGDIDGIAGNAGNAYHVVTSTTASSTSILDGFTITGGNSNGPAGFGGGMRIESSPTLQNLIITNNASILMGGGVFLNSPSNIVPEISYIRPTFTNVTISNNSAGDAGGGLYAQNASPIINNVIFAGNTAPNDAGGGMSSQTLTATDAPSIPRLSNVVFNGNTGRGGGGLHVNNSDAVLNSVTFNGNTALRRGGGMFNEFSNPSLTNVTFSGNISNESVVGAPWGGGGIMNLASDPILNNVTFNGNNSLNGSGTGGGDAMKNMTGSDPIIDNSILWGDGGISDEVLTDGTSTATIRDSVVQGGCPAGATCTNVFNTDPVLGALASNGGFTQTMAISALGSAFDAGGFNTACAATDQRGIVRPQGAACDIGAYEIGDTVPPVLQSFTRQNPATSPTNADTLVFRATFNEAVANVSIGDFAVNGTTTATVTGVATVSASVYDITVSGGDLAGFNGVVGLNLAGAQNITDLAGNALPAGEPVTDETYTVDNSGPSVAIGAPSLSATTTGPVDFPITVTDATAINLLVGNVTLNTTGTATGTISVFNGTTANPTVRISGTTGNGTIGISIAAGIAFDASANPSLAAGPSATFTVDNTGPTVTINQAGLPQTDPTNLSPVNFTVVFSEATTDFATGDVALTGSAGATTGTVTGGPITFNVAVSGMTGDGTVIANILAGVATDALGNTNSASTSTDNSVTYDTSGPLLTIGAPSAAITTAGPVDFPITITGSTTINLVAGNVTLNTTGTASGTVSVTNGTTTNPTVTVTAITGSGTIGISIAAGVASDGAGNATAAAGPSATFIVDNGGPVVTASIPANTASVTGPTQLTVTYNEDVKNDGSAGAANNTINYLLVEAGTNTVFNTVSCLGGAVADDVTIAVNSATYTNNGGSGPFVATLGINGGVALPVGVYQLYVCGTTSVQDLAGNELNNGAADTIIQFTVVLALPGAGGGGAATPRSALIPATGFPKGEVTSLGVQPAEKAYAATEMWIEIPSLKVKMSIVGVPQTKDGWDVSWLGRDAGWLNGSAFPTWNGNSVLTGHVWDAYNKPGPFALLKNLKYGDQVKIHAFGQIFVYEIRESKLISPTGISSMMKHEEKSWLTLITCEDYRETSQTYSSRRMVRAVLVSVTEEK